MKFNVTSVWYLLSIGWISTFILNTPSSVQTRWFEKAKDSVDGHYSQGVANDGAYWYFSARQALFKTNFDFDLIIVKQNPENPIPKFLRDQGYDHIGDIAYFEDKIYAPIEDVSYVKPIIGIYDADSLDFTGEFVQVPQSHFAWIAVAPQTGFFYSSEFSGVNKLYVYDPEQKFTLIDQVPLNVTLSRVQGGAFLGNLLYLACDNGDYVYEVEIASGTVTPVIQVPSGPEMEGIEAYDLDTGLLHFVAETGSQKNIFYHYGPPLAHNLKVNSIVLPKKNMPIWGNFTPMAILSNIGENDEESIQMVCTIDTSGIELYHDVQTISSLPSLVDSTIVFAEWTPGKAGSYNFSFYSELTSDSDSSNDTLTLAIDVSNVLDDFELGLGKWEQEVGWKLSVMGQGHNSSFSLWSTPRPYENNTDSPITFIPSLDLSSFRPEDGVTLSFWTKNRLEENKDFLYLEVSTDGRSWSQLGQFTGRDNTWDQSLHSLSSFSGPGNENVHIRFRLVTDDSGTDKGVRIDDVEILLGISTAVEEDLNNGKIPKGFRLFQNYPNPFILSQKSSFGPVTIIEYSIPVGEEVTIGIYNILGRRVKTFIKKNLKAGFHKIQWDGKDDLGRKVAPGVYLYRIESGNFAEVKKLLLLR